MLLEKRKYFHRGSCGGFPLSSPSRVFFISSLLQKIGIFGLAQSKGRNLHVKLPFTIHLHGLHHAASRSLAVIARFHPHKTTY